MKFLVGALAFVLTLGLSYQTLAKAKTPHKAAVQKAAPVQKAAAAPAEPAKTVEQEKAGTDKHDNSGMPVKGEIEQAKNNDEHNAEKSEHGGLVEKMNSLFPTKMPNTELAARPTMVEIKSPTFLTSVGAGPVKLEWNEVKGATNYHLQVATDPNFKWLVVNEKFVKETTYNFSAEAGKRYYWRVASYNGGNATSFTKSNFVSSAFNVK